MDRALRLNLLMELRLFGMEMGGVFSTARASDLDPTPQNTTAPRQEADMGPLSCLNLGEGGAFRGLDGNSHRPERSRAASARLQQPLFFADEQWFQRAPGSRFRRLRDSYLRLVPLGFLSPRASLGRKTSTRPIRVCWDFRFRKR